jgi:hypothetical protein
MQHRGLLVCAMSMGSVSGMSSEGIASVRKTFMRFCVTFSGFGLLLCSRSGCVSNARVAHLRSHNAKIFKSEHAPQRFLSHP